LALEASEGLLENGRIQREYKGYIASFGAMVRSAGLKPAIAFYESKSSRVAQARGKLMRAILDIVTRENGGRTYETLMVYVHEHNTGKTKRNILDAATALKLAIRTFDFGEDQNGQS